MSAPTLGAGSAPPSPGNIAHPRAGALHVALLGNPNTGKSTLFNAMTGMRQRVGNFPGVTVERLEGSYRAPDGTKVTVIDLPGSYSLSPRTPDETIALDVLLGRARGVPVPDVIVVVLDALHLERNLFLASQLLELGRPVVVALNQVDAAQDAGVSIDVVELIHALGATVIPTVATTGQGVDRLRHAIARAAELPRTERRFELPPPVQEALAPVEAALVRDGVAAEVAPLEALLHLTVSAHDHGAEVNERLDHARARLAAAGVNAESIEAELRYRWISDVVERTVTRVGARRRSTSDRVDAVLLHKGWGPLVFLALMALMFQSVFTWAAPLQEGVEGVLGWLGGAVSAGLAEGDLRSLLVDGVFAGVGGVLVFLPQIAILFLFIGILEDSGYMARAAFIMDRYMRRVGLHGRSFIPLLSGYACAVPAIMSTRTIEHPKDRLATIMVVPLMSCSARLPVYTLLIAAFVPAVSVAGIFDLRGLTMLGMYLLGTVAALAVAAVFKRTLLRAPVQPLIIELPPYRIPRLRGLAMSVAHRASLFLRKAGTIILAVSIVLWAMATYPKSGVPAGMGEAAAQEHQLANSAIGRVGRAIEPTVAPLGFDWKIGVSIISSFAAREVFVSTMGTIYGVGSGEDDTRVAALGERLKEERNPRTGERVYTTLTALGLMVFYVFALMCASTVAVTVREAGGGRVGAAWALLQFSYMLALAWGSAWLVHRVGTALGFGA